MAVDTTGLRSQVARLNRRIFDDAAQGMLKEAEGAAPVDTGETVRSGRIAARAQAATAQRAKLRFPTPQAEWTDAGTRPHVIRPKTKRALAFTVGGRSVVVTRVNHPGNPGTRWFTDTVTDSRWRSLLQRAANTITT